MAKLEQGILGPFRGKVGTVVGYLWRGKHVVRAYRKEINYPNTESQQAEREWFVGMVRFAATARQALLLGLRERAAREQMTEGNLFVKMNKGCFGREAACGVSGVAVKDTSDAARFIPTDYERIRIAEGAAAPVLFSAARVDGDGVLSVDFEKNSGMTRAKACDRVYLYVYNIDTREGLLSHSASRRDGRLQMQLPDGWNELNVRMWGFVVDGEGRASGSQYVAMEGDVLEDGDAVDVVESPDGAFEEMDTLGQAIKRASLTGFCRDDGGGDTDAPLGATEKKQFYHIGNHCDVIIL